MPRRCIMNKTIIRTARVAIGQIIMTLPMKQCTALQTLSKLKLAKIGTGVYFTIPWTNWLQRHLDGKKASIEATGELSVIVTSELLASGSCNDDVTISQQLFTF